MQFNSILSNIQSDYTCVCVCMCVLKENVGQCISLWELTSG